MEIEGKLIPKQFVRIMQELGLDEDSITRDVDTASEGEYVQAYKLDVSTFEHRPIGYTLNVYLPSGDTDELPNITYITMGVNGNYDFREELKERLDDMNPANPKDKHYTSCEEICDDIDDPNNTKPENVPVLRTLYQHLLSVLNEGEEE